MDTAQSSRSAPASPASTRQMLDELDALMERMLSLPVSDQEPTKAEPPKPEPVKRPRAKSPDREPPTHSTVSARLTVIESPPGDFGPHSPDPEAHEERVSVRFPGMLELPPIAEEAPTFSPTPSWFDLPEEETESAPAQESPAADESPAVAEVPESPVAEMSAVESRAAAEMPPTVEVLTKVAADLWLEKPSESSWEQTSTNAETETTLAPLTPLIAPPLPFGVQTPYVSTPKLSRQVRSKLGYRPLLRLNRRFDSAMGWLGPLGRALRGRQGRNLLGITGLGLMLGALLWLAKDWMGWNW